MDHSRRDLGEDHLSEKRDQVVLEPVLVTGDVNRAALALRENFEFGDEAVGGLLKGLALFEFARAVLPDEAKVPIQGDILGARQAVFLRRRPTLTTSDRTRRLPMRAVGSPVNLNLAVHHGVAGCLHRSLLRPQNTPIVLGLC